jgi:signal transduction histidine kinase
MFAVVYLINAGVAGAVMWFGFMGNEQKERRERLIGELTGANQRLEESLTENAELQARLLGQAREAGIGEERQRLAREIHDTLAQSLIGIITQLQAAEALPVESPERVGHVGAAIGLARESLTEARRSVRALQPVPLESARLPEAIADVAARWSVLNRVEATVTTTGAARTMCPEIEVALLRTAQEALANVAKHARAHRVGLTLSYMEDVVTLDVRDDGVGFPAVVVRNGDRPVDRGGGGFGLAAMRQRVQGAGGTLEIESEPDGGGTAICASVPAVPADGVPT